MSHEMPAIPGFIFERVLGAGATSVVYQVRRDGKPYALKLIRPRSESSARQDRLRFLKEAATIAKLNHPGLVKLHEIDEFENRPFLLMELADGESLKDRIARDSLSEAEIVGFARQISRVLDYVHCRGVIHRDLKPENILIHASGDIKIIDFGLATAMSEISRENESEKGSLTGTLLYASPEQTGMLKRAADSRSDLYSLGVVLYHCATGRPPFTADSAGELLQRHLTVKPTAPAVVNSQIRRAFSAIIMKLLNKDPDDRYQSARGILSDLENLSEIELRGEPFGLGARDSGVRYVELPFVGRENELSLALRVRDAALSGRGAALMILGESGSGKSRLVRELLSARKSNGFLALSGKAKNGEVLPFGPLREAIDDLIGQSARGPASEHERVVKGLRATAGDLAGIIRRLSPGLHELFGDAKEIPPLDGNAEQERFYLKVAEFFLALPKVFGPTALLINDAQWLDDGTLEVIRQLAKQISSAPFLLAVTSRNDHDSRAAIKKLNDALQDAKPAEIALKPLDISATSQLVAAHLGDKALEMSSVERIATKANGNPFAIGEYIRAFVDSGLIRPTEKTWVFDHQNARELELPGDVIQLLLNRIGNLPAESIGVLSMAAVAGSEFDPELLVHTMAGRRELVHRAISDGLSHALIEKMDHGYGFVHNRILEALVGGLSSDRLQIVHQRLAVALEAQPSGSPERLYALARHYYNGLRSENGAKIFQTSLAAGTHALENFSNEEALELLRRALEAGRGISLPPAELSRIYECVGVACTRLGRSQEAVENFQMALEQQEPAVDRARLHYLIGLARASEGNHDLAKTELFQALELLEQPFPRTSPTSVLSLVFHWFAAGLRVRTRIGYGRASGDERLRRLLVSKIHNALSVLAYLLGDGLLMAQAMVRELHNVQFLGVCVETAKAHIFYSILVGFMARKKATERHGRIAINMAYQLGDSETIAHCEMNHGLAVEFAGDSVLGRQKIMAAFPKVARFCAAWDKSIAIGHMTHMIVHGQARQMLAWNEQTIPVLLQTGDLSMISIVYNVLEAAHLLLGNRAEAAKLAHAQTKIPEKIRNSPISLNTVYMDTLTIKLMLGEFDSDLEHAIAELRRVGLEIYHSRHREAMIGMVRVGQALRESDPAKKRQLIREAERLARRSGWPRTLTPNHRALDQVFKGALASIKGNFKKAERYLAEAERLANASQHPWAHWMVARERARIAHVQNDSSEREAQAFKALKIAAANGWMPLVAEIERDFQVSKFASKSEGNGLSLHPVHHGRLRTAERNAQALLQINLASASTIDPELQSSAILDELVRILGAERAFLFVEDPESPGQLVKRGGRDNEQRDIKDLQGYSSTVVKKVAETKAPLVVCGTEEGEALGAESIALHNLRSILAVPVLFRDKFIGVIYLDSTLAKGIFTPDDLEIVMAMANHIAISLETARSALSLKRELERQVEERTRELAEERAKSLESSRLASLGEMAAGIAHEINNPLAIIRASAEQIEFRAKALGEAGILKATSRIITVADRVAKIVKGLRSYSRDGRGDPMAEFSVHQLVHDTAVFCQERFRNNGVELRIPEIDPALSLFGREVQVSQVLLNMLNNAFEALKLSGKTGWVAVEVRSFESAIEIHIVDSGPGVPKGLEWKIMQPFFTTKPVGTGTGLGLSISRSIMEAHNGQLTLDTNSVNTRFILRFPRPVAREVAS